MGYPVDSKVITSWDCPGYSTWYSVRDHKINGFMFSSLSLIFLQWWVTPHLHVYVTASGKIPTFCKLHQNWDFAIFSIYNVWMTSFLSVCIYVQLYVSELQCFVLTLPMLWAVKFHVSILTMFKMSDFCRPVT